VVAAQPGELGVSEIARCSGLSKSTVHGLLSALVDEHLLAAHRSTYHLGTALAELGTQARHDAPTAVLQPILGETARSTGDTAVFGRVHADEVRILMVEPGAGSLNLTVRVGSAVPVAAGALAKAYLAKARKQGAGAEALGAIETFFAGISADVRRIERARLAAEPSHLKALAQFAERAYRRPLTAAERDDLLAFYHTLRRRDGMGHEEALRDAIASVLLSPHFCYRIDLAGPDAAARPLPDYAPASRPSYLLWSSMPDAELIARAEAGDLQRPDVMVSQARRMLKDDRARGLALEFAGNWLDFRRFEEHNAVDRERFPSFNNELREAMFQEPVRFIGDVIRNGRSVLDLLYGNYTFVNPALARHYGMPEVAGDAGILVDPFDVQAIYAGMRALAGDELMLTRLRVESLQRAQQFSWRTAAAQVRDVYRMLLEPYPRPIERNPVLGAASD